MFFITYKRPFIKYSTFCPQLNWEDKIKFWVAAKNYHLLAKDLQKLRLTIIAFSPQASAEQQDSYWSLKNHKQTGRWLKEMLLHQSAELKVKVPESNLLELLDVNTVVSIPPAIITSNLKL